MAFNIVVSLPSTLSTLEDAATLDLSRVRGELTAFTQKNVYASSPIGITSADRNG
jgi:hypothetical protein